MDNSLAIKIREDLLDLLESFGLCFEFVTTGKIVLVVKGVYQLESSIGLCWKMDTSRMLM